MEDGAIRHGSRWWCSPSAASTQPASCWSDSLPFCGFFHVSVVERSVPWRRRSPQPCASDSGPRRVGLGGSQDLSSRVTARRHPLHRDLRDRGRASTAPEILRGLGYWFFYGNDKFGAWIRPSIEYTQGVCSVLDLRTGGPGLISATTVRWRHRSFFLGCSSWRAHRHRFASLRRSVVSGRLFKDFTRSDAGLALRSTPRAALHGGTRDSVLIGCVTAAAQERVPGSARHLPF